MEIGAYSHIGKVRQRNEDAYYISEDARLFIVADGMGGHNAGEVASNIAIESIKKSMQENLENTQYKDDEEIYDLLKKAIEKSNEDIFEKSQNEKACKGMGTTLTVAWILSKAYIAQIGDSRAYLLHKGEITQVTQDHSLVAELLRNGTITENEAKIHPQRNMITRALGTEKNIVIDWYTLPLEKDDMILLCTDGLSNLIDTEEIENVLLNCKNVQHACEHLVGLANEKGGYDNITVVAMRKQ